MATRPLMPRLIIPRPLLLAGQALVIPQMDPLADLAEVAAGVFTVAVEVVLADAVEVLGWQGREVALAHDLLADVVDAVAWSMR